jgi:hypothetical protein
MERPSEERFFRVPDSKPTGPIESARELGEKRGDLRDGQTYYSSTQSRQ